MVFIVFRFIGKLRGSLFLITKLGIIFRSYKQLLNCGNIGEGKALREGKALFENSGRCATLLPYLVVGLYFLTIMNGVSHRKIYSWMIICTVILFVL